MERIFTAHKYPGWWVFAQCLRRRIYGADVLMARIDTFLQIGLQANF